MLDVRRYELIYVNPSGEVATNVTVASDGELVSVNVPADSVDIVREDVASSTSRTRLFHKGDEAVTIPAVGFNIGRDARLVRSNAAANTKSPPSFFSRRGRR